MAEDIAHDGTWTVDTLREYLLAVINANDRQYGSRFEASQAAVREAFQAQQTAMQTALIAQKLAIDTALAAADRATAKAELANDKRFDAVNEFRATLSDQQNTMMPRTESMAMHKSTDDKIAALQSNNDARLESLKTSMDKNYDNLISELSAIKENMSRLAGKSAGVSSLWGIIIGAIGILGVIASIIINIVK